MPDPQTPTRDSRSRRSRAVHGLAALGLAVVVATGAAACGSAGSGGESVPQSGFISGDGGVTILPVEDRPVAPVVSGPLVGESETTLSTQAEDGKVLVINVWGSWCAPCRKEAPELVAAAERTADRAQFVGLNTRDLDPLPAEAFERGFGVPYPSIYDPSGQLLLEFSDQLPPSGIPSTLVIDPQGRVAARIIGATTASTLVGVIDDVAASE